MSDLQKYIEKQLEDPEFCEEYYATRNEAKKSFYDLREQAADIPEMTLDEINDEIAVVRTELRASRKAVPDDAMQALFSKLDEAIDDVENGRVISEEELWEEHKKENNEEGFVMGDVEVTEKPSSILKVARDKYVQKNPLSMDEIDKERA